jgi:prepilin-type N-terminal cleavage/methylation domain-containing protein
MDESRGFTLLEVVLAAAMLALVVVVCVQLIRSPVSHPRPMLTSALAESATAQTQDPEQTFASHVGVSISGRWVISRPSHGYMLRWERTTGAFP